MKKIVSIALFLSMLAGILTGCGLDVPRPEVKEGRFNISFTYVYNGETKTLSGVYVCKYDGIACTLDGTFYVDWAERFEGEINDAVTTVCTTEDGGEIVLSLLMYPEYFMGDPRYAEFTPTLCLELFYYEGENGTISDSCDDPEIIESYGVKLISFAYDKPIENIFR